MLYLCMSLIFSNLAFRIYFYLSEGNLHFWKKHQSTYLQLLLPFLYQQKNSYKSTQQIPNICQEPFLLFHRMSSSTLRVQTSKLMFNSLSRLSNSILSHNWQTNTKSIFFKLQSSQVLSFRKSFLYSCYLTIWRVSN